MGTAYRLPDILIAGVRTAVADVISQRTVQQRGVLGHHADLVAQRGLGDFSNVLSVDQNAPALQVVKAQQQVRQGRFSRPGAANQADLFTGFDGQAKTIEDVFALPFCLGILEAQRIEDDLAVGHGQRFGGGRVFHRRLLGDGVHAILHRADVFKQPSDFP